MTQLRNIDLISPVKTKTLPSPEILKGNKDTSGPSKGELKRKMDRLQELGKRLVELPSGKLARIEIPEKLRDAVEEARRITSLGALRRQIQFIGRIMEEFDAAVIARDLRDIDQAFQAPIQAHVANTKSESLRMAEELIEGGDAMLFARYGDLFDGQEMQQVRQALRTAQKNIHAGKDIAKEVAGLSQKIANLMLHS